MSNQKKLSGKYKRTKYESELEQEAGRLGLLVQKLSKQLEEAGLVPVE